ncbi:MAG: hemerythrin family protein [Burkholderiales bacterium]|nr:hemerythrin family protein [Burkholderiales bacterium]
MSDISEFNKSANAGTDREHEVQLGLLEALCQAVREGRDAQSVALNLAQLRSYSEAHFASEELLMRLKSYEDYAAHVEDHERMLDALRDIADNHALGKSALVAGNVENVLEFIQWHIATRDRKFADMVRSSK